MNLGERGVVQSTQPEEITRREAIPRIVGLAAALALFIAGCNEVYPPPGTGPRGDGKRPAVPEPEIDEDAARDVSVVSAVAIGVSLFFLRNIR